MRFIVHKERGVFLTADEAMSNLDAGQLEAFEDDFKTYALNQGLRDSLHPFKVTNKQFTSASDGSVNFESDYMHFLDGCYTVTGSTINKVSFISEDEKAEALTSQLRPVSTSWPLAEGTATGFQLYPQTQQTGFYSYLRRPATPVLAFSQVGRALTYNAGASTQLEWTDNYVNNIIARALAYSTVFMDEDKVLQFSQLKQAQTTT
jgi:hypothetical protein